MQNFASGRLFVSFSYNYKWKLYQGISTEGGIYQFSPKATQLMVFSENIKFLLFFLNLDLLHMLY